MAPLESAAVARIPRSGILQSTRVERTPARSWLGWVVPACAMCRATDLTRPGSGGTSQPEDGRMLSARQTGEKGRIEDQDLVARAKTGNEVAFEELWQRYRGAIFGLTRTRSLCDVDAEEIVDRIRDRLWKAFGRYDPVRASVYTFFRYYALCERLRFYSKHARQPKVLFGELEQRYADCERDADIDDLIARRGAESGDAGPLTAELCSRLLRLLMQAEAGYPWQVLAFMFRHLVNHWTPQKIDSVLSPNLLRRLEARIEHDFTEESSMPPDDVVREFEPLRTRMDLPPTAVIQDRDGATRLLIEQRSLTMKQVGDTRFPDYYGERQAPAGILANWVCRVRARIIRALLDEGWHVPEAEGRGRACPRPA